MNRPHGRPVLGGVFGFLFFLFVALDLLFFGVIPLNSPVLTVLPVVGIVAGIAWAYWAPLGGRVRVPRTRPDGEPGQ